METRSFQCLSVSHLISNRLGTEAFAAPCSNRVYMVMGKRASAESAAGAVGETHMIGDIGAGGAQPRGAGAKRSDCVDRPLNHVRDVSRSGLGPKARARCS